MVFKVLDPSCAQVTQKGGFSGVHGTGLGVLEGFMGAGGSPIVL